MEVGGSPRLISRYSCRRYSPRGYPYTSYAYEAGGYGGWWPPSADLQAFLQWVDAREKGDVLLHREFTEAELYDLMRAVLLGSQAGHTCDEAKENEDGSEKHEGQDGTLVERRDAAGAGEPHGADEDEPPQQPALENHPARVWEPHEADHDEFPPQLALEHDPAGPPTTPMILSCEPLGKGAGGPPSPAPHQPFLY